MRYYFRCLTLLLTLAGNASIHAASATYLLVPGQPLLISNSLSHPVSASCLMHAALNVVNSISIKMIQGNGLFNGTSIQRGDTLYQNILNSQYIPLIASNNASAIITNLSPYTIQAECIMT
ncbi:MAG: hypothetical protein CK426_07770 [Legionella sp.]|nr:MAG: hypothetical protein CK423_05620 [Legionella sp.]PJD97772.1 MAG: hypothetical protein CK426_07770 [Legionella sp.]